MSLSKNLALACFNVSFLLKVESDFSDSLDSDDWDGDDLSSVLSWLDDDAFCITELSVSSDLITLLMDELLFFESTSSSCSVRFGGSLFSSTGLFVVEFFSSSISSSWRRGVVSQILLSAFTASSMGDFAIS